MTLPIAFLSLAGGLALLLFAGDLLVRGAGSAALKAGISPLFAGVVIVGFGTSAPEMLVALDSALSGKEGLAFGNIVGSNIANIWLVLAVPAMFCAIHTTGEGLKRTLTATVIATAAWMALTFYLGVTPLVGIVFLLALIAYLLIAFNSARRNENAAADVEDEINPVSGWATIAGLTAGGMIGLPLGAHLAIEGGVVVGGHFGLSQTAIGLFMLAVGTSLPELAAGIAAGLRKNTDVIIGNVLGSNLFNILGAGGIVSLFGPFAYPESFHGFDHIVMAIALLSVAGYALLRRSIGWAAGVLFLTLYVAYMLIVLEIWVPSWI